MSILEERTPPNNKIHDLLFSLRYKNNPIKLVGSASLKSQTYYGDFDMMSAINKSDDANTIYYEFKKILEKINKDPNLYFIELKIELNDNKKFKYYKDDVLDLQTIKKHLKNISFFKIDLGMWDEYAFHEVSIIYMLFNDKLTTELIEKSIRGEIKEYEKTGLYYKVLKRKFLLYKNTVDVKKLKELTKIFNSEIGLKYKIASNLEIINLVHEYYNDSHTNERIMINLKFLHLEHYKIRDLEKEAKKLKKEVNEKAHSFLPKFIV